MSSHFLCLSFIRFCTSATIGTSPKIYHFLNSHNSANGSVESIFNWANAAGLDAWQKRSFESILSSFLLTFHNFEEEEYNEVTITDRLSTRARNIKKGLQTLMGVGSGCQLLMLLHGPGWSGKSTIIFLVIAYAREYCHLLGHPFTIRTIIVTAMSGVAATLIHGETTHMSMGSNRSNVFQK